MPELQLREVFDTVRVPLVQGNQSILPATTEHGNIDEMMLNCFSQSSINPITGEKETWVTKRPGMRTLSIDLTSILGAVNSQAVANIAIVALNDICVAAVFDNTNDKFVICQYRPVTGTTTKIGEITGASFLDELFLTELTIANVATLGVIWNSSNGTTSKGYYATSSAGVFTAASLTEITDVDFPPKAASPLPLVGPMIQMNGTTYVLTNTGEIHGSDLNSITSWNSLNLVQAISFPDQGIGLFRYKNYILAFGENSIEWFTDVGNPAPASALQRQEQAMIKFGAPHAKSIVNVDDTIYWIGRSSTGTSGLWKMDGFEPIKISGPVQDNIINNVSGSSQTGNIWQLLPISLLGQKHIIIGGAITLSSLVNKATFTGDPHTWTIPDMAIGHLVYNIAEQKFWNFSICDIGTADYFWCCPISVAGFQLANVQTSVQYCLLTNRIAGDASGAYLWKIDPGFAVWGDDDISGGTDLQPYPFVYQPNRVMFNNQKKKRLHKFHAIFDFIFYDETAPNEPSYLWFLYMKDRWGISGSTTETRFISIPNTSGRYYTPNLGAARSWALGLASLNLMPMRLRALELDVSQGTQ